MEMGSLPFGEMEMVFRGGFGGGGGFVGSSSTSNLVLDPERGELVRSMKAGKKAADVGPEMKAAMATKSHCEAERRRRERINSHLSTLRGLVPTTAKMDKAALLSQVIMQVKELKNNASKISRKIQLPSDTDEVAVEACIDETNHGGILIKASICCQDRPEFLSDLKKTIRSLHLQIMSSEISFLEGRVKNEFVVACEGNSSTTSGSDMEKSKNQVRISLQKALESVLARISAQVEFSPRALLAGGKRRQSPFESSPYSLSFI